MSVTEYHLSMSRCNVILFWTERRRRARPREEASSQPAASSGSGPLGAGGRGVGEPTRRPAGPGAQEEEEDVAAWPGRHLLEGGEHRRYFGLRTAEHRVIEFECSSQREYDM
uniref:Pleckstrin-like plant domain-containing protein n=1 Tax=Oryza brachyantha TaxID=4533 RepID=J3LD51_ORYBR